jgi:release factor glutamine methyltransferase
VAAATVRPSREEVTVREVLREAASRLAAAGCPSPRLDAELLLADALEVDRAALYAAPERRLEGGAVERCEAWLARREVREPVAYILGRRAFRRLELRVDRRVLIPRPETEVVAGVAVAELRRLGGGDRPVTALDLGTGSGAIALSLAAEVRTAQVWATDRSADALAVARANLAGLGRPGARVRLAQGDWFEALPAELRGSVQLVVSNPPYVGEGEALPAEVADWEPRAALVAGPRGDEALARVVAEAGAWLARPGSLVLEVAPHQATAVATCAEGAGYGPVEVGQDLAGRDRVLVARV